ncbi:MAG TPA: DUF1697 domain-containing protein [Brumimicrobium sp.]|nr:DUF1697 domain-containing protein [Brumimicrobium sp.]
MEGKIAILRGINVGGKRKILMADLKTMFKELGFPEVITYIQSGNVIFESNHENKKLAEQIETAIHSVFGHDVPVIIISLGELKKAIESNPFNTNEADINKLHLTFLKESPSIENLETVNSYNSQPDRFQIIEKNAFICIEGKYHESKLSNAFFEKKLKVGATTRNWKTVVKLLELGRK